MLKHSAAALAIVLLAAAPAFAVPNYTTSVTVAYDQNAGSFTGNGFQSASNNSSYVVRTGADSTNFYVDVTSTPNANTDQSLQFANIYLGGLNFNTGLIFEVTNDRVSTTADPGTYYSLANTGFTYTAAQNDISFALPFSFLETNPLNIAGFNDQSPGNQVRISYSQAFGYSLVAGSNFDPVTRLGAQTIPAAAVPEPASMAVLGAGLLGLGLVRRRKA